MSVDHNAVLMYGKQFESLKHAIDFLIGEGAITKQDYDYAIDNNELPNDFELVFVIIDCYCGEAGMLGIFIDPSMLNDVSLVGHLDDIMDRADAIIGAGCEIELFVVTS